MHREPDLRHALRRQDGFTILETMAVLAITCVMLAVTIAMGSSAMERSKADSASASIVATLNLARTMAVSERRNFHLEFVAPNRILLQRVQVPSNTLMLVQESYLENGLEFMRFAGQPDTPDAFGATGPISFGTSPRRMFTPAASFVDQPENILNGTIFVGKKGDPTSARAITIFGVTGLIRVWKWIGDRWVE